MTKTNEAGKAIVAAAIVKVVLPACYDCIDELLSAVDPKLIPKQLLVQCRRLLPSTYKHSFESKVKT